MFRPCGERVCNFKIQKSSICSNRLRIFNFDNINHSWNPPPPLPTPIIKEGGGQDLTKIDSLRGGRKFCQKRGDKPEKGGLMQIWRGEGGVATFFTTLQFSSITFTFSDLLSFDLAMQDFHPRSHPSLVLKPGIICTFLIHSGSLQKMLTALSNLVWNTQKSKWANFFLSAKAKCFLVSKRFYKR